MNRDESVPSPDVDWRARIRALQPQMSDEEFEEFMVDIEAIIDKHVAILKAKREYDKLSTC